MANDVVWEALADPTRRRIVELLTRAPMRAGAVAGAFDSTAPTISRHLRVLRRAGLIEETRVEDDARVKVYRLRQEPFGDLGAWVDQVQAFWRDRLEGFADAVADELSADELSADELSAGELTAGERDEDRKKDER